MSYTQLRNAVDEGVLDGQWSLVYCSEAAYRSSPFFAAFRKLTDGIPALPGGGALAESVFSITDGLPFYRIGSVQQTLKGML
jgi:hypothetical protein